jgi:hypothetical protein
MERAGGIPDFDENGNLPPGVHLVALRDVREQLTWNAERQALFAGLRRALVCLAVAGVRRVVIAGSFASSKPHPRDVDGFWVYEPGVDLDALDPTLKDEAIPRRAMKARFRVDFLVCWTGWGGSEARELIRFFASDKEGDVRGLLLVHPAEAL